MVAAKGSTTPASDVSAAAGVAVLYAGYQVRLTRALAKQTLAYQYFERFSRHSLEIPYETAKAFSFDPPSDKALAQERWDEFKRWEKEDESKVRDIMFIFNFFEELGGVYKNGAADRQVIDDYLGKFALEFWNHLHWFISRIRRDRTATLFEDWEGAEPAAWKFNEVGSVVEPRNLTMGGEIVSTKSQRRCRPGCVHCRSSL